MHTLWILLLLPSFIFAEGPHDNFLAPIPALKSELAQKFKGKGDFSERLIERVGDKTIQMQIYISVEADYESAVRIFSEPSKWREWALVNINTRPSGGTYRLQVLDLKPKTESPQVIHASFFVNVPLIRKTLLLDFNVTTQENDGAFTVIGDGVPEAVSLIEHSRVGLRIFKADKNPERIWFYAKALVKLSSRLLYEALPEQLLKRETGERLQIIIDNFLHEENKRLTAGPTPSSSAAISRDP